MLVLHVGMLGQGILYLPGHAQYNYRLYVFAHPTIRLTLNTSQQLSHTTYQR